MDLLELRYRKADLEAAPRHHRLAFLGLAQIADENSALLRLALSSVNSFGDHQAERDSATASALFALRMLAGRIAEARLFVDTLEVSSAFRELEAWAREHHPGSLPLIEVARGGRARLGAALPRNGLIRRLRDETSFHVDPQLIEASFNALPPDIELVDHHSNTVGNSIFGAAETLHMTAIAHILGEENYEAAMIEAQRQITRAVGDLADFINGYAVIFSIRYLLLGPGMPRTEVKSEKLADIRFPLFVETAE